MLRIVQQTSANAAKGYFASGFVGCGDEVGEWGGRGSARLGLSGEVTREAFARLCENHHPASGERLTPRTKSFRRVGYDISFHVPKSVSVVFEWGRDPAILDAFRRAVHETLADMEADARTRVRTCAANGERVTRNLVYATFVHRTARPVGGVPDPHLHAHCFVLNATFDETEGRWKAVDLAAVKRDAPYFEALFHTRLAAGLARLGYGIARTGPGWELAGVPDRVLREFSRRTQVVEARARALAVTDPRAKDRLGARTREGKGPPFGAEELRIVWAARLAPGERSALDRVCQRHGASDTSVHPSERVALAFSVGRVFERRSVVPERTLLTPALRFAVGRVTPESLRREYPQLGIVRRERDGAYLVTTREVLAEEAELLAFARRGRGVCPPLGRAIDSTDRTQLSDELRLVVRRVLNSTDRVVLVRVTAGIRKSTLVREVVRAIESEGRPVIALAPSVETNRDALRAEGRANADTVARFLLAPELQARARGGVIWVDGASLLARRPLVRLFRLATSLSARVVLFDDPRCASVEREPVIQLLETEAGLVPVELTVRRQPDAHRNVTSLPSAGRPPATVLGRDPSVASKSWAEWRRGHQRPPSCAPAPGSLLADRPNERAGEVSL